MKGIGVARPDGPRVALGRLLVRPYAAAGSRSELLIASVCIVLIGSVYTVEVLTPNDYVIMVIALLPLLFAVWVLSGRLAGLVALVTALLFGADVAIDGANRTTVVFTGATVFATAIAARLYATSLASLLSNRRHLRPSVPTLATASTLDGIDRSSHGVRSLTRREFEVARLAAEGYTAAEIGNHLHIGNRTVESHLAGVYSKLRIRSRAELIRMAPRLGALSRAPHDL